MLPFSWAYTLGWWTFPQLLNIPDSFCLARARAYARRREEQFSETHRRRAMMSHTPVIIVGFWPFWAGINHRFEQKLTVRRCSGSHFLPVMRSSGGQGPGVWPTSETGGYFRIRTVRTWMFLPLLPGRLGPLPTGFKPV